MPPLRSLLTLPPTLSSSSKSATLRQNLLTSSPFDMFQRVSKSEHARVMKYFVESSD